MKILVAGVQRIAGTSSKSGLPYDMCNVICLVPVEAVANAKMNLTGTGYKVMEIPLDPVCLPTFAGHKFPCVLDLDTEPRPRSGKVETVVTGIAAAAALKAA